MKHYLKYTAEGAYCGEDISQTANGLFFSVEATIFPKKTTCPECLAKLEADAVRMKAIRKKHQIQDAAPDLLEALEAIDNAAELVTGHGEFAFGYTTSGLAPALKQVRTAIQKAKS